MPKNQNIVTKLVHPNPVAATASGQAVAVGSSVAAGMKRYVTFIAITPAVQTNAGRRIYFCSTTSVAYASTNAKASTTAKFIYVQVSHTSVYDKNFHMPRKIDTEKPLFVIAASKFLTVHQTSATTGSGQADVFVQYYDQ